MGCVLWQHHPAGWPPGLLQLRASRLLQACNRGGLLPPPLSHDCPPAAQRCHALMPLKQCACACTATHALCTCHVERAHYTELR